MFFHLEYFQFRCTIHAVIQIKREGTVKSLLSRAMDKLAEQLKMQPFEGGSILVEEDIEL
jgi:hypothetical protein